MNTAREALRDLGYEMEMLSSLTGVLIKRIQRDLRKINKHLHCKIVNGNSALDGHLCGNGLVIYYQTTERYIAIFSHDHMSQVGAAQGFLVNGTAMSELSFRTQACLKKLLKKLIEDLKVPLYSVKASVEHKLIGYDEYFKPRT